MVYYSIIMKKILSKKVSQVMTKKVVTLKANDAISHVKEMFKKYGFNAFPVVDGRNNFIGMVSKTDFLKFFTMGITISRSKFYNLFADEVSGIMVKFSDVVNPKSKIIEAANLMVEYGYRTIPVVNKNRRLAGIITSTDIVKYTMLELKRKK
jgi:CBS domain-containing membrane protein